MIKNPYNWTSNDVAQWLSVIQCSNARDIFLFHGIEGRDLLQLTDADLRFDLQFKRIHDRKYILRKIQDLRNHTTTMVEIHSLDRICRIRVADIHSYTFDMLRKDAARFFDINPNECVIIDSNGLMWGSVPIACLFDSNFRQQESVQLEERKETSKITEEKKHTPIITDEDQEDFNEDNPFHEYAVRNSSTYSPILTESQERLSPIYKPRQTAFSNIDSVKETLSILKVAEESSVQSSRDQLGHNYSKKSQTPKEYKSDPSIAISEEEIELKDVLHLISK